MSGDTSDGDVRDSDSISTGTASSLRDATIDDSPDKSRSKTGSESRSDKLVANGNGKVSSSRKSSAEGSLKSSPSVRSKTSVTSKTSSDDGEKSKNPLKLLKKLTKFDKPSVKKVDFQ